MTYRATCYSLMAWWQDVSGDVWPIIHGAGPSGTHANSVTPSLVAVAAFDLLVFERGNTANLGRYLDERCILLEL